MYQLENRSLFAHDWSITAILFPRSPLGQEVCADSSSHGDGFADGSTHAQAEETSGKICGMAEDRPEELLQVYHLCRWISNSKTVRCYSSGCILRR